MITKNKIGIYVHIRFCKKKCDYCDFISYCGKDDLIEKYVDSVKKEIDHVKIKSEITTIYIGGGTPSYIDSKYIVEILAKLKQKLQNNETKFNNIEITIEVNPGTITNSKIKDYKKSGINRISIGLQSTNNNLLKEIGRIHNYNQFLDTYKWANEVGFENINVDLMLGIPNQKIEDLKDSLEKIVNLKPKHISVYSLIVEEATPIEKMINSGELKLPEEEEERNEYHYTKNYLELNGYKHYEISNFAIDGYESKHNTNCWKQKSYIGFGIAAHSYMNGVRYSNTTDLKQYIIKSSKEIKTIHEKQNKEDMKKEYMMLGLRMLDGVKISEFKAKFGENPIFLFRKELEKLVNEELIEIDLDNIKLTNKGLDLANLVWEEFV